MVCCMSKEQVDNNLDWILSMDVYQETRVLHWLYKVIFQKLRKVKALISTDIDAALNVVDKKEDELHVLTWTDAEIAIL